MRASPVSSKVGSDDELDGLYAGPAEAVLRAITDRIHSFHRAYLAVATFCCVGTGQDRGMDVSPRGGPSGFVHVLDDRTVAFADWPGNNRIESMRNLVRDDRIAMLFLFPGLEVFMRINGIASVSTDPAILASLMEGGRQPKAATLVSTREILFHCGKAINRSKLWEEESRIDRKALPSIGQILTELGKVRDVSIEELDAHYDESVRKDLY
jgi:PPOX class probable FMN-dependent enzyme